MAGGRVQRKAPGAGAAGGVKYGRLVLVIAALRSPDEFFEVSFRDRSRLPADMELPPLHVEDPGRGDFQRAADLVIDAADQEPRLFPPISLFPPNMFSFSSNKFAGGSLEYNP